MRSNSGIIGGTVTINPYQASGVFTPEQISIAAKNKQWAVGNDLTKIFPAAYLNLIRSCKNVFYVKESDGYDGIKEAINKCEGGPHDTTSNNAIVILPGSYDCGNGTIFRGTSLIQNNGSPLLYDSGHAINFVCAPGQVTLSYVQNRTTAPSGSQGARDCVTTLFQHAYSKLIGAYIKRNNGGSVDNYSVAWFHRQHQGQPSSNSAIFHGITSNMTKDLMSGGLYNSVLREVNANGFWSRTYMPVGTSKHKVSNSVIYSSVAGLNDFDNDSNQLWDYIACNTTKGTGTTPWTNSVESVSFNSNFSYTGNAAGVYSGTYAWDASLTTVSTSS